MLRAEELRAFTCIRCPRGCPLEVSFNNQEEITDISGYFCMKGKEYAIEESTDPRRMVSSLVYVDGCLEPLSVKTEAAIPKTLLYEVADEIRALKVAGPIHQGDVLIEDVCGTGINVIATKSLDLCV